MDKRVLEQLIVAVANFMVQVLFRKDCEVLWDLDQDFQVVAEHSKVIVMYDEAVVHA